ncbi:hypothetical protein L195_g016018, partial [Trifolium pratense]
MNGLCGDGKRHGGAGANRSWSARFGLVGADSESWRGCKRAAMNGAAQVDACTAVGGAREEAAALGEQEEA